MKLLDEDESREKPTSIAQVVHAGSSRNNSAKSNSDSNKFVPANLKKKKDYGIRKPSDLLIDMANSLKHDTREASSTSSVVDFAGPSTSTVQRPGQSRRSSLFSLIPMRKLDNQRDEAETARIEKEEYKEKLQKERKNE